MSELTSSQDPLAARRSIAALAAVLILSSAWFVLPRAWRQTVASARLAGLPYESRRDLVLGEFYTSLRALERGLPSSAPLPILMRRKHDVDRAIFASYYLYPRICRLYFIDQYRGGLRGAQPDRVAVIDLDSSEAVRLATYEEVRAEEFGAKAVVQAPVASSPAGREFIVPLVTSVDGPAPDVYKTEAVFSIAEDVKGDARVILTFYPSGIKRSIEVRAGRSVVVRDLVHDVFGAIAMGWLSVSASAPIRCGFWFVNAGTRSATPMPALQLPLPRNVTVAGGEKLWIVNGSESPTLIHINGTARTIPPRELAWFPAEPLSHVESDGAVITWSSRKLPAGGTEFHWPGATR